MSTFTNAHITKLARESLSGKWNLVVKVTLVLFLITLLIELFPFGGAIGLLIAGSLRVGYSLFILHVINKKEAGIDDLFESFKNFGTNLAAFLLMALFIILWSILLIIPGIIAAIAYSQTFFILAEDNKIGALAALRKSKEMMRGHKWQFFLLGLRFIGWSILCLFTLGIGFLWLAPYMTASFAHFYEQIKGHKHE